MIVVACLDDGGGMLFNKRRQSKDEVLRQKLMEEVGTAKLYMNAYTKKQFTDCEGDNIIVEEKFLDKAQGGDFCFVENVDITPYKEKIEKIMLFKWNRDYPRDVSFPTELLQQGWTMTSTEDFVGHSHEKITKEVYEHGEKVEQ